MKRAEEELCKAQFDTFIEQFFTLQEVAWEEVAQGDEPPDYYLCLGNTRFAVEVTALMELHSVGSSSRLPPPVIHMLLRQFVDQVEEIAREKEYLRGDYLVSFPAPIADFADVKNRIRDSCLDYLRRTRYVEAAPLEIVFERIISEQRSQQCKIQKLGSEPNRVATAGPVWAKWRGEATGDLCDLLKESLNTKADKLKGIGEPKILVLLNQYPLADRKMYEACVHCLSSLAHFHTVFVVLNQNEGFPLHSHNRDWLKRWCKEHGGLTRRGADPYPCPLNYHVLPVKMAVVQAGFASDDGWVGSQQP